MWAPFISVPGTPLLSLYRPNSNPAFPPPCLPADTSSFVTVALAVGVKATATQVWKGKFAPPWATVLPQMLKYVAFGYKLKLPAMILSPASSLGAGVISDGGCMALTNRPSGLKTNWSWTGAAKARLANRKRQETESVMLFFIAGFSMEELIAPPVERR
jgi:hypothetical protein